MTRMSSRDADAATGSTPAATADPHATNMQRLVDAVLRGPGTLDRGIRGAAADGVDVPEALRGYLDKVMRHAYKVTDEDTEALRFAGYSEDQIFEATVSCALGAGMRRLEAGLSAIERGA
jgi:alkylhydroperoxidase family enzyme